LAVAAFAASLVFTLIINVPINLATGRWDAASTGRLGTHAWPLGTRPRHRSWLLLIGFILMCAASTT